MEPEDIDDIVNDLKKQMDADKDVTFTLDEIIEKTYEQNESRGMKTLRKHLGNDIVFTGVWADATEERQLEESELLPGELSAVTFTLGCYTIRSAQRVYKELKDYSEAPADGEDIAYLKELKASPLTGRWIDNYERNEKFYINQEIMAKHNSDPKDVFEGNFKYVCCATEKYRFPQTINFICTLKESASSSDEHASLFVFIEHICDSFRTEDWYKLTPNGVIRKYGTHSYNPASFEASWKDTE